MPCRYCTPKAKKHLSSQCWGSGGSCTTSGKAPEEMCQKTLCSCLAPKSEASSSNSPPSLASCSCVRGCKGWTSCLAATATSGAWMFVCFFLCHLMEDKHLGLQMVQQILRSLRLIEIARLLFLWHKRSAIVE